MSRLIVSALTVLMIIGAMSLDQRSAMAAGSVSVTAWTCPDDFDTAIDDVAVFTETCSIEAADLTFALTSGEITRRRVTAAGKPASWPSVSGKLTVTLEKPENENGALFCSLDGAEPAQVEVKNASAELDLTTGNSLDCQWYRLPSSPASPVASPSIPTVKTAIPSPIVTATSTNTPTQIPSPFPTSTRTPTQTATAIPTNVPTDTATATVTSSPTLTPTLRPTESPEPTDTPSSTPTTEPTATPSAKPSATSTPTVPPTIPPSATPQPTSTTPPTATAFPTATEAPTQPPAATATKEPGPKALSTQIAAAIDGREPDYHLDLHQMTYEFADDLLVYPDPDGPQEGQFALTNFVLVATFINPPRDDDGVWDYGILFGPTTAGDNYRFTVTSTGEWILLRGTEIERQGEVEGLLADFRERNTLRFIVYEDRALLYLNDELVTTVRLDDRDQDGQLWLATTNKDSNEIAFLDLDVWSIPD